jgi:hypothetical protein
VQPKAWSKVFEGRRRTPSEATRPVPATGLSAAGSRGQDYEQMIRTAALSALYLAAMALLVAAYSLH